MMNLRILVLCFLLIALLWFFSARVKVNYEDPTEPMFLGSFAEDQPDFSGSIMVITYNIHFSENPDGVIKELQEIPRIDILLIQEADEQGVEWIAHSLKMNYVYFPASIHPHHNKNFGNAILSPWPLREPQKIILPYTNPRNGQIRIAAHALVAVDQVEILAYSVHLETIWLNHKKRLEQVDFLVNTINTDGAYRIVGGDFNTLSSKSIHKVEDRFREIGMVNVTHDIGITTNQSLLGFSMDYIFSSGMDVLDFGKLSESEASDHLPVWANLELVEGRMSEWMQNVR